MNIFKVLGNKGTCNELNNRYIHAAKFGQRTAKFGQIEIH